VFSFLGAMSIKLLLDAGIAVYGSHLLLLCDNAFGPYIERGLRGAGASVDCAAAIPEIPGKEKYDAVVVALQPRAEALLGRDEARRIATLSDGIVVVQFWGDIRRDEFEQIGIAVSPDQPPQPGHMGILPSAIGPEPVIRLQTGGLKVGELLSRARRAGHSPNEAIQLAARSGFADPIAGYDFGAR